MGVEAIAEKLVGVWIRIRFGIEHGVDANLDQPIDNVAAQIELEVSVTRRRLKKTLVVRRLLQEWRWKLGIRCK